MRTCLQAYKNTGIPILSRKASRDKNENLGESNQATIFGLGKHWSQLGETATQAMEK